VILIVWLEDFAKSTIASFFGICLKVAIFDNSD